MSRNNELKGSVIVGSCEILNAASFVCGVGDEGLAIARQRQWQQQGLFAVRGGFLQVDSPG